MRAVLGSVRSIGLFPVKSMQGESPRSVHVGPAGLDGDRTHGLVDVDTGKVASAKDPRVWGRLLAFRATRLADGAVEIELPGGARLRSDAPDVDARLSEELGRRVRLEAVLPDGAGYDLVWEVDAMAPDDVVAMTRHGTTDEGRPVSTMPMAVMAPGTFQDVAPVTLLTTAALAAMAAVHPEADWSPSRFRSNLVLDVDGVGVVENDWPGRRLAVGGVVLQVTTPSPRCVMTTLPQLGLPRDRGILQAVARHNRVPFGAFGDWACLGAYADVVEPGAVNVGDEVALLPA